MELPTTDDIIEFLAIYYRFRNSRVFLASGNKERVSKVEAKYHILRTETPEERLKKMADFETERGLKFDREFIERVTINQKPLPITDIEEINFECIAALKEKTSFQRWFESTQFFSFRVKDFLTSRPMRVWSWGGEVRNKDEYSKFEERLWRLEFITACGLFAYYNAEKIPGYLVQEKLGDFKVSIKTVNAAKKLKGYLVEDGLREANSRLLKNLDSLIEKRSVPIRVSESQRRKIAIRELALVGQREMLPKKSEKGRFFADIVLDIIALLDPTVDSRTINAQMEPYDQANGHDLLPAFYNTHATLISNKENRARHQTFLENLRTQHENS